MTTVTGTKQTTSAQYASSIESAPRPSGLMNPAALQKWLEGQVGQMWDKVSDATNGVDARNNAQRDLTELARRATAGEPITAQEVRDVAAKMPEGEERDNVLKLVAGCASDESLAAAQKTLDQANQEVADLKQKVSGLLTTPGSWQFNQYTAQLVVAQGKATAASVTLSGLQASTTVSGAGVAKGFENASGALEKKNNLAMTELQYMASTAQQAMSLVSNILKVQGDMADGAIRNLV